MLAAITADVAKLLLPVVTVVAVAAASSADPAAENAAAELVEQGRLSQILQGYSTDPWFAKKSNRLVLEVPGGMYYRNGSLVIPEVRELKREILQEFA